MNFLINCSNLKKGGGLQVGDSISECLVRWPQHHFVVVLSSQMDATAHAICGYQNVSVVRHDISNGWRTLLCGREAVLDGLVEQKNIDAVLTVFGPARWIPRCKHVCGFARAQLVLGNSPYYQRMSWKEREKARVMNALMSRLFSRGVDTFWTENPYITEKVRQLFRGKRVETATNYYNQIFDQVAQQREHPLPPFEGCTLLSVNAPYPHKNLAICIEAAKLLRERYPDFSFRFVLTVKAEDLPPIPTDLLRHFCLIGRVDVAECPSLYRQADIMFQPTLLECFTATYPEAMRMEVPIVTTDIEFARGLCGEAAVYYSPLSAESAAETIWLVATDQILRAKLVRSGKEQLKTYDNYSERAGKLIRLLEEAATGKA